MALFRRFLWKKTPDRLLEISERVYVFHRCFSEEAAAEDFPSYSRRVFAQLQELFPETSFLVVNVRDEGEGSEASDVLSGFDMAVMDFPRLYEGCPLLPAEMIRNFLRSADSWLSQQNVLLLHCEPLGWPTMAFLLAGLLLYRKTYDGELKALDAVYNQAPKGLSRCPVDPKPSHLRYLHYICSSGGVSRWSIEGAPMVLTCFIIKGFPKFEGKSERGIQIRVRGRDPVGSVEKIPKVLATVRKSMDDLEKDAKEESVRLSIGCHVQGDIVLECFHLDDSLGPEKLVFRFMFNTAFIHSNILILSREKIDIDWNMKEQFLKDFRAEVCFSSIKEARTEIQHDSPCKETSAEGCYEASESFNKKNSHEGKSNHADPLVHQTVKSMDVHADVAKLSAENSAIQKKPDNDDVVKLNAENTAIQKKPDENSRSGAFSTITEISHEQVASDSAPDSANQITRQDSHTLSSTSEGRLSDEMKGKSCNANLGLDSCGSFFKKAVEEKVPSQVSLSVDKQPESPSSVRKLSTILRWIVPEKKSEATSMNPAPHLPSRYGSSPAALAMLGESPMDNAEEMQHGRPSTPVPERPPSITPSPSCPPAIATSSSTPCPPPPPPPPCKFALPSRNQNNSEIPPKVQLPPPPPLPCTSEFPSKNPIKDEIPQKLPPPPPPPLIGLPTSSRLSTVLAPQPIPPPPPPFPSGRRPTAPPPPPPLTKFGTGGKSLPPSNSTNGSGVELPRMRSPALPTNLKKADAPTSLTPAGGPSRAQSRSPGSSRGRGARPRSPSPLKLAPRRFSLKPLHWIKLTRAMQGSIWADLQQLDDSSGAADFDLAEIEALFSISVAKSNDNAFGKSKSRRRVHGSKFNKIHLMDLRRVNNCEIMLTKVKMPLADMMNAVLALDDSALDSDQVENLIRFCPTKEEMDILKAYTGEKESLGKCEQFFLELMKVPRIEAKLRVFLFKIQFASQISDLRQSLNIILCACNELRSSVKLKEIMKMILVIGNTLNQGTARGSAIGFRLESLLKLTDTRASNGTMTLMHYLCKKLSTKSPHLLDFHEDLVNLESASKIQLKYLAEEMQAVYLGLDKVKNEMEESMNDGPVSAFFRKVLRDFIVASQAEVVSLVSLYKEVGKAIDALALYFGDDPTRFSFEQGLATLLNFIRMFRAACLESSKMAELERKKKQNNTDIAKGKVMSPSRTNAR